MWTADDVVDSVFLIYLKLIDSSEYSSHLFHRF
nr:MAG TPA: hypothetical protein [Caudoviricetes sp.]